MIAWLRCAAHFGVVVAAYVGGRLIPTPGAPWDGRDRRVRPADPP